MNGFILCIICCSYILFLCSLELKTFCYEPIEIKNIIEKQQNLLAQPPAKMAGETPVSRKDNLNQSPSPNMQYKNGGKGNLGKYS